MNNQRHINEDKMLELQLTMATTSMNHEYAEEEYRDTVNFENREALLSYMTECRNKYLEARNKLANYDPVVLETFERDLMFRRLVTVTH